MGRLSYPADLDSPSKQLLLDLSRDLEQFHIHSSELKQVKAWERKTFYERLDRIDSECEAIHYAALDKVAARHDQVREEAQETLRAHQRAVEEEKRRKEEEARREAERLERERAEKLRREQEEAARREAERKAAEEAKRKAEEEAEKKRKAEQEEKERKEKERLEEENRTRQAEAQKAEQEAAQRKAEAAQKTQAEQQKQIGGGRQTAEETKVQLRYVELHQHLKKFRQYLKDESKTNAAVKQNMGDIRRSIKKCVGQLREGAGANKTQLQEIRSSLEKAASIAEPSVDVRQFFAFPPADIANSDDNKVPALLIYALNIFSKCLVSALITEASINHGHAEPIGIVAAQIFSMEAFIYKGHQMVDLLLAKYRVVCPALWGFYGNEKTEAGRRAIGWWRDGPDGPFITEQAHADRMTALGAGFAALTLRNFGKTQRRNPFPNTLFWYAMHKILTVPTDEIQETHITLLSAMLKSSAERIVGFFGHMGLALMRRAIVELPNRLTRQSMGVNQLKLLKDLYRKEKNILI
ncbi:putative RNA export mediator Gle1 [Aspergillus clavatus NRRL 1]|uniref:mRNA export factor GLE1 n=1 Tax=Aspergillus clavatus (strain ATCC 1007 / CBS 513.65 / DSM 816 / NCTC 3887 / NRRL 1 / QM 1276 / 107) TaxID=344612 RepID=A1CPY8_ASPCL|nr:RNA export mediator Gle1, putative [Aspergillus clavatus NRRL 1]EAW07709.1 RNA export mediator Gle1, putative [Aspergillus clavatus NRRL 1]